MLHLDLFSGIGGFALAAERVWPDIEHVFCEVDTFCQAILRKHWPQSKIYGDIKTFTNTERAGLERREQSKTAWLSTNESTAEHRAYILTGGFPCQPFSQAGRRKGTADDRHLWPEMRRVIQEFSPRYVVAENVRGLLSIEGGIVFEQVCLDLEALGYEVQSFVIPACAVNAPHRRDRVWIVGHAKHARQHVSKNRQGSGEGSNRDAKGSDENGKSTRPALSRNDAAYSEHKPTRYTKRGRADEGTPARAAGSNSWDEDWPTVATRLCRLDDGLPDGLPRPRGWRNAALKAYGNAIVPQVAIEIMKAIKQYDS